MTKLYRGRECHGMHRGRNCVAVWNRAHLEESMPKLEGDKHWTIGPSRDNPSNRHLDFDGGPRLRSAIAKLRLIADPNV